MKCAALRLNLLAVAGLVAYAQDPLQILQKNYHLLLENPTVRVVEVLYRPHEKLPVHEHPKTPTVYVYLTNSGPVRFSHLERPAFSLVRPPEIAGTFRVSPGRIELHAVDNLGDIPTEFLRIELKTVPLKFQENSFRSIRHFDVSKSAITTEFPSSRFRIDRIVAVGPERSAVTDVGAPSLLVPISSTALSADGHDSLLKQGQVYWMEANRPLVVAAPGKAPANLLRIVFPN